VHVATSGEVRHMWSSRRRRRAAAAACSLTVIAVVVSVNDRLHAVQLTTTSALSPDSDCVTLRTCRLLASGYGGVAIIRLRLRFVVVPYSSKKFCTVDVMLASTDRSLEIERQRRSQLRRLDPFRGSGHSATGCRIDPFTETSSPRRSEQFVKRTGPKTTTVLLTPNVGQSMVTGAVAGDSCVNTSSGDVMYTENRQKVKNGSKPAGGVRIRQYKVMMSDSATSNTFSGTKVVPDKVAEDRSAPLSIDTPERRADDKRLTSGRGSQTFTTRRWSSLKDLPGRTEVSQSTAADSGDRRTVSGRRTSRLDRHVYQCYFAGILHSSRRSERFLRLQQLYAVLENAVEMESEMLALRQRITPSATDLRGDQSPHSSNATDPSTQKHWCQRLLELRKLYAKLDAAQDDKEFFYDNGRLDAFQWKSWKDLGLNRKSTSLAKLRDLFETAVDNGRSANTTLSSQLQHVEYGLSYRKLLGMFRQLEKRARKEAEDWLRWQSSSQQSVTSGRRLDGTYMKMMESAARNAKALALHGYHMNEHRNRYDAYVQSRRLYRPTSSHSVLQLSSDNQLDTDEVESSDRTASTSSLCVSTRYCNESSDAATAKPASDLTDSSQVPSPVASIGSGPNYSTSAQHADTCTEGEPIGSGDVAAAVSDSSPEVVNGDKLSAQRQVKTVDVVRELDTAVVKLDSRSKQNPRKRERQRPRFRNQNGTLDQRTDTVGVAVPGSAGRRHIEAWRRSSRPLSGTLNQALDYFNSLCIDDSCSDKNNRLAPNCDLVAPPREGRETCDHTNDAKISDQLTPPLPASSENKELTAAQLADRGKKYSIEIQLDVNGGESIFVPDRRQIVLPHLYPCHNDVRGTDVSTSSAASLPPPMCSRAVNIDKHRSQSKIDTMERNDQSGTYANANANADATKTEAETVGVQPVTSQSVVTTTPEVHPTYVRPAPVARMLSESQPIQTTSVSSPMFVDCRQAVVRKLPTSINQRCQQSAEHHPPAYKTSSASNHRTVCTDEILTVEFVGANSADEAKPTVKPKSEASEMTVAAAQRSSLSEDLPRVRMNVTYVTAIDSSSFTCKRCCRPLAGCSCVSTTETGAPCASEDRRDDADYYRRGSNDSGTSVLLRSADNFTQTASRSSADFRQQPMIGAVASSYHKPRSIIGNGPGLGRQDVEMRRMMSSLEMIDSEWTSGRPTRLTRPVRFTSDMNSNDNSQARQPDERRLTPGQLNQREIHRITQCHIPCAASSSEGPPYLRIQRLL